MGTRLRDITTPVSKTRKRISDFHSRFSEKLTSGQKFWIGFAVLCVLTTVLINNPFWKTATGDQYRIGDIARESIISPADITVTDVEETEKLREISRDSVRPIFTSSGSRAEEAVQGFRSSWESLRRNNQNLNSNENSKVNSNQIAEGKWRGAGGTDVGKVFSARSFSQNEIDSITRVLRESATGSIFDDKDQQFFQNEIILIDPKKPNQQSVISMPESTMTSLSDARNNLLGGLKQIRSLSEREVEAFNAALSPLIQPNVIFDSVATNNAKDSISQSVEPVKISLKRGQTVVREGDTIRVDTLAQISAIRNYSTSKRNLNRFLGLLALITALFWAAWKFIQHRGVVPRLSLTEEKTFALFGVIVLIQTALMTAFFRLAEFTSAQNGNAPFNDPTLWSFAIPFAFGSLLITLLADRRTALFTGLFLSIIAGFIAPKSLEFVLYAAIASAVSVYGIGPYRSRQSVTIAGALVGVASAAATVALIAYSQQPFILNTVLLAVGCGLASGLITAAVTAMILPMCETFFGILTDVKLLELSNADLPILGQLALKAPGTNQHSHAVGQLTEDACRVVGANALLARIGALYHDIGKSAAPEHFVENQMGKNPHDKLKPAQSAKIIISHVTYGIKLAKELGLPQRIVDFIPQHHGTRTLHYFLRKAQAEAHNPEDISENEFRYPGPKPQFKEAAIMMIADSCEAAARSLSEPSPDNIRYIVTKIIDAILLDDQLDDCDLTLRELTQIRESMIKSLVAIYHSRVQYPGYIPPPSAQKIEVAANFDSEERGLHYHKPEEIPVSLGGEIEEEAIDESFQPDTEITIPVKTS